MMNYQKIKQFLPVLSCGILALAALRSCKPIDLLNLIIPRKGYSVLYDIPYGDYSRQTLDIYLPDTPDSSHSTIVFFYGGSWQSGDKNQYRFVGQAFASQGFIVVIVNYRLYPEVYFPVFIKDGAKAIQWVHSNIQQYGGSNQHVFLAGHSAGAHIASLLATDESYLLAQGGNFSWIKGVIGIAGPYDFLPLTDSNLKTLFSQVPAEETQPIHFVKANLPVFLLVTGDHDQRVLPRNTVNFAKKLRLYHVQVSEIIYPDIGHISIILSLAAGFRYKTSLLKDITEFVKTTTMMQGSPENSEPLKNQ